MNRENQSGDILADLTAAAEIVCRKMAAVSDPRIEKAFLSIPMDRWSHHTEPGEGEYGVTDVWGFQSLNVYRPQEGLFGRLFKGSPSFYVAHHRVDPTPKMLQFCEALVKYTKAEDSTRRKKEIDEALISKPEPKPKPVQEKPSGYLCDCDDDFGGCEFSHKPGRCGRRTIPGQGGWALLCPDCKVRQERTRAATKRLRNNK